MAENDNFLVLNDDGTVKSSFSIQWATGMGQAMAMEIAAVCTTPASIPIVVARYQLHAGDAIAYIAGVAISTLAEHLAIHIRAAAE